MSARTLDVPGLEPLQGVGVYYGAAMTEAARYRGQGCLRRRRRQLGGPGRAVLLALRAPRDDARARPRPAARRCPAISSTASAPTPNIEVVHGVEVEAVHGERVAGIGGREGRPTSGERRTIPASAMFIFIGVQPHTDAFAGVLERDEAGFVLTGADLPQEHGRPRGWPLERAAVHVRDEHARACSPPATCAPAPTAGSRPRWARARRRSTRCTATCGRSDQCRGQTSPTQRPDGPSRAAPRARQGARERARLAGRARDAARVRRRRGGDARRARRRRTLLIVLCRAHRHPRGSRRGLAQDLRVAGRRRRRRDAVLARRVAAQRRGGRGADGGAGDRRRSRCRR